MPSYQDDPAARFENIVRRLQDFRTAREWQQFDTLKDLAAAIAIETSELQEILLWHRSADETDVLRQEKAKLSDELADIMIHCLNFATLAGIDPLDAIEKKIQKNEESYPVEQSRGSPMKRSKDT